MRDSFAYSTIWMGDIAAETGDGRLIVDVASFLTRDEIGIAQAVKDGGGGEFRLVPELSVADPNSVRVFPQNIEIEGRLTFTSAAPTAEVSNIAPATGNLSFVVRHSLIRLPEPGYRAAPLRSARRERSAARSSISASRSAGRSSTSSPTASGWRRSTPMRRARGCAARSSSTSTAPRPSRSAPP